MKTKTSIMLAFATITSMLLALVTPVHATAPEALEITADMWVNLDGVTADGTFSANGVISEINQPAVETFFMDVAEGTIHGVKTLSGVHGTIIIKFQAAFTSPTTCVGTFVIISGTGDYTKLHGVGITDATIDPMTGHLVAIYTGTGHIN